MRVSIEAQVNTPSASIPVQAQQPHCRPFQPRQWRHEQRDRKRQKDPKQHGVVPKPPSPKTIFLQTPTSHRCVDSLFLTQRTRIVTAYTPNLPALIERLADAPQPGQWTEFDRPRQVAFLEALADRNSGDSIPILRIPARRRSAVRALKRGPGSSPG